ncbi:hypothetical protein K2173_028262 [Erythroxylum novogranatense]|uniref:Uncharacterized protein n=1 Tax=Erythroxylum novogranatense TaxID=1862640 RepID=A0AAV8U530_9ROSI|nr:hypothetical protein K2173_028262 [Erythroxylum novogranatense]
MATASKTGNMLEKLVREGSFKWLLSKRSYFGKEFEEMRMSSSTRKSWISELSPFANTVVRRCSKILDIPTCELQKCFNEEAFDSIKHQSRYARNFLEYCCFKALALCVQQMCDLTDKKFRRLTYDMMLAWETPAAASQPLLNVDDELTVGIEAFSRIAPAVPVIANVVISENLFEVLTMSTGSRLQFSIYDKYLGGLESAIRRMTTQSDSSLLSAIRSSRREKILEVDGTVTTQPVLEHVGISTWPGRLTLTDHALYFEALRVVSFDKPKMYDLSDELKQVVKPELTGPWGTRLFDKAVYYKSISLSEPVVMEFPELKGHARRDYWLAIIREVLYAHRYVNKFHITGVARDEALLRAVLGILRLQAIQDISSLNPACYETLLMFNLCDQLPGGDLILETLANMSCTRELDSTNNYTAVNGMSSVSALVMVSNLGLVFGTSSSAPHGTSFAVGEIAVGEISVLERAVKESFQVVLARETVDRVKVDGVDTNVAVMKGLLFPVLEAVKLLLSLVYWNDSLKSLLFCLVFGYVIWRGWLGYAFGIAVLFLAIFMMITRWRNQGRPIDALKVTAPPPMNTMERLLAVQNAISQVEQLMKDGNIFLLKLRALLLSIFPQATEKLAITLALMALVLAFIPIKNIILLTFLETFTRYSPLRRGSAERWTRRLRDWWYSIPAAPVLLQRQKEVKKKK